MSRYSRLSINHVLHHCVTRSFICIVLIASLAFVASTAKAVDTETKKTEADTKSETIKMSEGKLTLAVPAGFKKEKVKNNIIEHEFSAAAVEGDSLNGRITIMGAGGDVDSNIDRWLSQFKQADGSKMTKEKAKIDKKSISEMDVHIVDISGIYMDSPAGPFANGKATVRDGYRMLSAIVVGPQGVGNYFVKFYGPEKTVTKYEGDFKKMIDSLKKGS